jgi:hypothetical protein
MEPMKPMSPMKPMEPPERWWPNDLGNPSTVGSQNGMRYAFFSSTRRLIIERRGHLTTYDTGNHDIGGVSQADGRTQTIEFTSQHGPVNLMELDIIG